MLTEKKYQAMWSRFSKIRVLGKI